MSNVASGMARLFQKWWLTAILFAGYLSVFHLWIGRPPNFVLVSCLGATCLFAAIIGVGFRTRFFTDRIDSLTHGTLALDVLLEGTLIPTHESHGFYLCALAFAIVTISYRHWTLTRRSTISPEAT